MTEKGRVYIIGAGPGDPGLITLRGAQCIREADVIVYDHLVSPEILRHAGEKARLIYAGKQGGRPYPFPGGDQRASGRGGRKGGDRRAGSRAAIPSSSAGAARRRRSSGRRASPSRSFPASLRPSPFPPMRGSRSPTGATPSSVAFVTGHEDPTKGKSDLDWPTLAGIGTLVFLMGVKNLSGDCGEPDPPRERRGDAGRPDPLGDDAGPGDADRDPRRYRAEGRGAPFRPALHPRRRRRGRPPGDPELVRDETPLRPGDRHHPAGGPGGGVAELLRRGRGAGDPFPGDPDRSAGDLGAARSRRSTGSKSYRWIIFTSANGVAFFFRRLRERGGTSGTSRGSGSPRSARRRPRRSRRWGSAWISFRRSSSPKGWSRPLPGRISREAGSSSRGRQEARDVIPEGLANMGATVRCRDDLPDRPFGPERLRTGAPFRRRQGGCDHLHEPLDGEQFPRDHGARFPPPAQGPDRLHRSGDRRGGPEGGSDRGYPPGALHDPGAGRGAGRLFHRKRNPADAAGAVHPFLRRPSPSAASRAWTTASGDTSTGS